VLHPANMRVAPDTAFRRAAEDSERSNFCVNRTGKQCPFGSRRAVRAGAALRKGVGRS
jgi:hypothetical protein